MKDELVSVIIATRNRNEYVNRAINSVLNQTYSDFEIIIVDDGSSPPVVIESDDSRIRVIRNEISSGSSAARNIGMRAAKGSYLCLLDDDDYYLPHKIALQLDYLRDNPDVDLVFSDVVILDEDSGRCLLPTKGDYSFDVFTNFLQMNRIHTNGTLFKSTVLEKVSFNEQLTKFDDTCFYLAVCLSFKVRYLRSTVATWTYDRSRMGSRVSTANSATIRENNYYSFSLICSTFEDYLTQHPRLESKYVEMLALLALEANHSMDAVRYLTKANLGIGYFTFLKLLTAVKVPLLRKLRYQWVWRKHCFHVSELGIS